MDSGKDLIGEKIRVRGEIRTLTYKTKTKNGAYFGVLKVECHSTIGTVPIELRGPRNEGGTLLPFTGFAPEMRQGVEYDFLGELVCDEKYGYQYNILRMAEHMEVTSKEDLEKFFAYVMPTETVKKLMSSLDDPASVLENGDIKTLMSINGIGYKTAIKILDKYREARVDMEAYVGLFKYGLTKNTIDKLLNRYISPEKVIQVIEGDWLE